MVLTYAADINATSDIRHTQLECDRTHETCHKEFISLLFRSFVSISLTIIYFRQSLLSRLHSGQGHRHGVGEEGTICEPPWFLAKKVYLAGSCQHYPQVS